MRSDDSTYRTRTEAEAILRDDKAYFLKTTFCPLINGQCRRDCVCFAEGGVTTVEKGKFKMDLWGCGNPMLGEHDDR